MSESVEKLTIVPPATHAIFEPSVGKSCVCLPLAQPRILHNLDNGSQSLSLHTQDSGAASQQ